MVDCCAQCLDWFVQLNWTGPPGDEVQVALEGMLSQEGLKLLNQQALTALSTDGEVGQVMPSTHLHHVDSNGVCVGSVQTLQVASAATGALYSPVVPVGDEGRGAPARQEISNEKSVCPTAIAGSSVFIIVVVTVWSGRRFGLSVRYAAHTVSVRYH